MVLIAASEIPKILKFAFLQLTGIFLLSDSSNSFLFDRSNMLLAQIESSSKNPFSIPK